MAGDTSEMIIRCADSIGIELRRLNATVAVAESVTAGHLQSGIAATSGASDYFLGGVTAYSLAKKVEILGVDRQEAEASNCVSDQVAAQMASGVAKLFDADFTIATTGYAEPYSERSIAMPYCWLAVWCRYPKHKNGRLNHVCEIQATESGRCAVQRELAALALKVLLDTLCGIA